MSARSAKIIAAAYFPSAFLTKRTKRLAAVFAKLAAVFVNGSAVETLDEFCRGFSFRIGVRNKINPYKGKADAEPNQKGGKHEFIPYRVEQYAKSKHRRGDCDKNNRHDYLATVGRIIVVVLACFTRPVIVVVMVMIVVMTHNAIINSTIIIFHARSRA